MCKHHLCWMDGQSSIKKVEECIRKITREGDIYVDGDHAERQYIVTNWFLSTVVLNNQSLISH